jgi:hypothetical protein
MATPTRVPNKVLWALEDILALCLGLRPHWMQALDQAARQGDTQEVIHLALLRDGLAEIERLAGDARRGEYHQRTDNRP